MPEQVMQEQQERQNDKTVAKSKPMYTETERQCNQKRERNEGRQDGLRGTAGSNRCPAGWTSHFVTGAATGRASRCLLLPRCPHPVSHHRSFASSPAGARRPSWQAEAALVGELTLLHTISRTDSSG